MEKRLAQMKDGRRENGNVAHKKKGGMKLGRKFLMIFCDSKKLKSWKKWSQLKSEIFTKTIHINY
jgi:hypothetical protein